MTIACCHLASFDDARAEPQPAPGATPLEAPAEAEGAPPRRPLAWHPAADVGGDPAPVRATEAPPARGEQRPFTFVQDPSTPGARALGVEYHVGVASGESAERPLPFDPSRGGIEQSLSAGYGVTASFAPVAVISLFHRAGRGDEADAGGGGGFRLRLTREDTSFRSSVSSFVLREHGGVMTSAGVFAASVDVHSVRVAGNLHVEHAFASSRDPLDVVLLAGVTYPVLPQLHVGVEYVGQDLEELGEGSSRAEGGASQFVGPSVGLAFAGNRIQLFASAARQLARDRAPLVGRGGALWTF